MWIPSPEPCDCAQAVAARKASEEAEAARKAAEAKAADDERQRKRIQKVIGASGMGDRFLRRTFDTFQETPENRAALKTARRFVDSFDRLLPDPAAGEPGKNGLFITGPVGTGKTHLAAAIANELLAQGKPVICMTMIDLLERIKSTYNTRQTAAMVCGGEADEGAVLRVYKTVPLLVIDDIGKEPPTDWAVSTIYNIINARYEAYLPTIVTTNYDTASLIARLTPPSTRDSMTATATLDRLNEMCRALTIGGKSWRQR